MKIGALPLMRSMKADSIDKCSRSGAEVKQNPGLQIAFAELLLRFYCKNVWGIKVTVAALVDSLTLHLK